MRGRRSGEGERLVAHARSLRNDETDAEHLLWQRLRARQCGGVKFRRQHPIPPFIADFCCVERRVVVELDGGQHCQRLEEDSRRTQILESQGYKVLRFWNTEVLMHLDTVLEVIHRAVTTPSP